MFMCKSAILKSSIEILLFFPSRIEKGRLELTEVVDEGSQTRPVKKAGIFQRTDLNLYRTLACG